MATIRLRFKCNARPKSNDLDMLSALEGAVRCEIRGQKTSLRNAKQALKV